MPSSAKAAASSARRGSSSEGAELIEDVRLGEVFRTFFQEGCNVPGSNSAFFFRAKPKRQYTDTAFFT